MGVVIVVPILFIGLAKRPKQIGSINIIQGTATGIRRVPLRVCGLKHSAVIQSVIQVNRKRGFRLSCLNA